MGEDYSSPLRIFGDRHRASLGEEEVARIVDRNRTARERGERKISLMSSEVYPDVRPLSDGEFQEVGEALVKAIRKKASRKSKRG